MILGLVDEAVVAGARRSQACRIIGLSARALERWRLPGGEGDQRATAHRPRPTNALSDLERSLILATANAVGFADLSPKQIVPLIADEGRYVASESSFYRVLRAEKQLAHRGKAKERTKQPSREHVATGPNQVWCWDITYLPCGIRGCFVYLYMVIDVWSRKVVAAQVHAEESPHRAAEMIRDTCQQMSIDPNGLVLHSDNGGPMKGLAMIEMLRSLGILASFSRPSVSNDNPFIESGFRTTKYRPNYPDRFETLDDARAWVTEFVDWYNNKHRHSGIRFVTPAQRHRGEDTAILANRDCVYKEARRRRPDRWSGNTRDWTPVGAVYLNPDATRELERVAA